VAPYYPIPHYVPPLSLSLSFNRHHTIRILTPCQSLLPSALLIALLYLSHPVSRSGLILSHSLQTIICAPGQSHTPPIPSLSLSLPYLNTTQYTIPLPHHSLPLVSICLSHVISMSFFLLPTPRDHILPQ
jgi:hypothetical protein